MYKLVSLYCGLRREDLKLGLADDFFTFDFGFQFYQKTFQKVEKDLDSVMDETLMIWSAAQRWL